VGEAGAIARIDLVTGTRVPFGAGEGRLQLSPDGRRLLCGGTRFFDLTTGKPLLSTEDEKGAMRDDVTAATFVAETGQIVHARFNEAGPSLNAFGHYEDVPPDNKRSLVLGEPHWTESGFVIAEESQLVPFVQLAAAPDGTRIFARDYDPSNGSTISV